MKLRIYLRQLRPIRTLVLSLVYSGFAWSWTHILLLNGDLSLVWFWFWCLGVPLSFGYMFAGPVLEVVHAPGSFLLPYLSKRLTLMHGVTVLLIAGLITGAAAYFQPVIPSAGVFGAAVLFTTLPLIRPIGIKALLINLGVLLLFALIIASRSAWPRDFVTHHPWTVLIFGLALSRTFFLSFLRRDSLRRRALQPFMSPQSTLFSRSVITQVQGQAVRERLSTSKAGLKSEWPRQPVLETEPDWERAVAYARLGVSRGWKLHRLQLSMWFGMAVPLALGLGLYSFLTRTPFTARWVATLISQSGWELQTLERDQAFMGRIFLMVVCVFSFLSLLVRPTPLMRYPISRRRMALLDFRLMLKQATYSLCSPYLVAIGLSLACTASLGFPLTLQSVEGFVSCWLISIAMAPALLYVTTLESTGLRNFILQTGMVVGGLAIFLLIIFARYGQILPILVWISPPLCLAGFILLRRYLLRFYGKRDLSRFTTSIVPNS